MRHAIRSLRRAPWYALSVASVIALSLALAATVFAVVDGTLFKPLPYPNADRLFAVAAGHSALADEARFSAVSPVDLSAWKTALPEASFSASYWGDWATVGPGFDLVRSGRIDANYLDVLGLRPVQGGFDTGDFDRSAPIAPALVTHGFFQNRLGGDTSSLGRVMVDEDGNGIRVAGVLPENFTPTDVFAPEVLKPLVIRPDSRGRSLRVIVRLPPGLNPQQAAARLTAAARQVAQTWPEPQLRPGTSERVRILAGPFDAVDLLPLRHALTGSTRRMAWVASAAAGFLLLLASLNVTGLAIARVRERESDLAVRRALGAGRLDIVRLLAVENGILVGAGLLAGLWLAPLAVRTTTLLMPGTLRLFKDPVVDERVVVFAALMAVCCLGVVTVFGARTAWRRSVLRHASSGGGVTSRPGSWILTSQVALGLIVTVGGALVATGLLRVWSEDPGLPVDGTAVVRMAQPRGAPAAEIERIVADIRSIPGVVAAGGLHRPLLERAFNGSVFGRPDGVTYNLSESIPVTTGFFDAAGLVPVAGRLPSREELSSGAPLLVVSERVAREFWPGEPAVGRMLATEGRPFTVVGVVPDVRYIALDDDPRGAIYWPVAAEETPAIGNVLIRFDAGITGPAGIVEAIRARCPACRVAEGTTLTDALASTIQPRRFRAWLFSAFGVAALATVGTGILGLVAMTTARRTREIGIRMALGSTPARVVRQILGEQALAVAAGLGAGALISAWTVRFVESYLYEMTVYDPVAWTLAIGVLLLVTLMAALLPSLRASRVDPVRALREA